MSAFDRAEYPREEPERLRAGDRWAWRRDDLGAVYDPASHTLKYLFVHGDSGATREVAAVADDGAYIVEVSSTATKDWPEGRWYWQAAIVRSSDGERITLGEGSLEVVAPADRSHDPRSHVRRTLEALEAALEGRASETQLESWVGDMRVRDMTHEELIRAISTYRAWAREEEAAERVRKGLGGAGTIRVRFWR